MCLVLLLVEGLWAPGSFELLLLGQVMEPTLGLNEVKDSFFQLWVVKMDFLIIVKFSRQRIPVFLQMVQYFGFPNIFNALWTLISLIDLQFEFREICNVWRLRGVFNPFELILLGFNKLSDLFAPHLNCSAVLNHQVQAPVLANDGDTVIVKDRRNLLFSHDGGVIGAD